MNRRDFLKTVVGAACAPALSSCFWRIDPFHVLIRSDRIDSLEQEEAIVAKARLEWSADQRVRVLYVRGSAYERGYQHGKLLRKEVQENIGYIYRRALQKFRSKELFAEAYERMRPFMSEDHLDEMHGLAHGSRMPLEVIHHVHVLADIGEWGGKKRLGKLLKQMLNGELATSCSNIAANASATKDGKMYVVRILDWGLHRISKLHEHPLLVVGVPDNGIPYLNIGWVGYLGAISGMNAEGITLGEMGYRNPPNETLSGVPMPFLLRDVLSQAHNLADVRKIIGGAVGSNSYLFLMTDGKTEEAELYVKDRDRFLIFHPNQEIRDEKEHLPPIQDTVYGGRYNDRLTDRLNHYHGQLTPELFMEELIPHFAMESNFQNVIYEPKSLKIWVANARNTSTKATEGPYTVFDFKQALESYGVSTKK